MPRDFVTLIIFKSKALEVKLEAQCVWAGACLVIFQCREDQYVFTGREPDFSIRVDLFFGVTFSLRILRGLSCLGVSVYWSFGIQGGGMRLELCSLIP